MEKFERKNILPEDEGKLGMKFIEGHPICGDCLKGKHSHSTKNEERADCKNTDEIKKKVYQCHCGFGGICKNGHWKSFEE